jgi:hypothetical protein
MGEWVAHNWFVLLQSAGIVGGLLFTAFSLRAETKAKRLACLIALTEQHRDIWKQLYARPALARVLDATADLGRAPLTTEEERFVILLILHLLSAYQAMMQDLVFTLGAVQQDVREFFSLPLPQAVWETVRPFQNRKFAAFVEACLADEPRPRPTRPCGFAKRNRSNEMACRPLSMPGHHPHLTL